MVINAGLRGVVGGDGGRVGRSQPCRKRLFLGKGFAVANERLIKSAKRRPIFEPGPDTVELHLGRSEIEMMVPHRDPFLLIDRISAMDLEQKAIRGHRQVSADDPVFAGQHGSGLNRSAHQRQQTDVYCDRLVLRREFHAQALPRHRDADCPARLAAEKPPSARPGGPRTWRLTEWTLRSEVSQSC